VADIFDEVQEDLRAERMQQLARRYGTLLAAALVLVVGGVGGWQGWNWYQNRNAGAAATAFIAAGTAAGAAGADLGAIAVQFDSMAGIAPPGYRMLAQLRAASLKLAAGDRPGALAAWDALASDAAVDPLYRELATLLWSLHGVETADPAALAARLAPLAEAGHPWQAAAREVQALLAIRQQQTEAARTTLRALSNDATAPDGVRERAGRLLAGLGS
jgi:hypothetical protein